MKKTRLCGLVIVALIAVLVWSSPAWALDHPWDGTKVSDSLAISSTTGPDGGESTDGEDSAPKSPWYSWFSNWINDLVGGNNEAKDAERVPENKVRESKDRGSEVSFKRFLER